MKAYNLDYLLLYVNLVLLGILYGLLTACALTEPQEPLTGPQGERGEPGAPAPAPVISIIPSLPGACLNGGYQIIVVSGDQTTNAEVCNGVNGLPGLDGLNGIDGQDGLNGTMVTVVQFCPDDEPEYPSTFPEMGLVIDGKLYAVYSKKGGFLAYVPPGTYQSNAVGSSCNFTVNEDGTISH